MSYDYLLCRAPPGLSRELAFDEFEPTEAIAGPDELMRAIAAVFPSIRWSRHDSHLGAAWFGRGGPPEFQITVGDGGPITNFMMSHATEDEVRLILDRLDLVALDLQREIVIGVE